MLSFLTNISSHYLSFFFRMCLHTIENDKFDLKSRDSNSYRITRQNSIKHYRLIFLRTYVCNLTRLTLSQTCKRQIAVEGVNFANAYQHFTVQLPVNKNLNRLFPSCLLEASLLECVSKNLHARSINYFQ